MKRTDIPNKVLQLTDLFPHTSLSNTVNLPPGQTRYLKRASTVWSTVATSGANPIVTVNAYQGLAAYLLDNIEAGGGTLAFTAAQANAAATALLAIADAGTALTLTTINAALAVVVAATTLTTNGSTGTVLEVLQIIGGRIYTVPAAAVIEAAGAKSTRKGSFDDTYFKPLVRGGVFEDSLLSGQVSKLKLATFRYKNTNGAAIVVYDDEGNVI
jgi:hypothetical protein